MNARSDPDRRLELQGLHFMLEKMLDQEKFDVAEYIRRRINEIQRLQLAPVEWKHALREMNLFLN